VTCAGRGSLATSTGWTDQRAEYGIFDSKDPRFAQMNKVYIPYCSSDGYTGSSDDNNNECGYYFRGHDIVQSIVSELVLT
jgi:hypothetical protein